MIVSDNGQLNKIAVQDVSPHILSQHIKLRRHVTKKVHVHGLSGKITKEVDLLFETGRIKHRCRYRPESTTTGDRCCQPVVLGPCHR